MNCSKNRERKMKIERKNRKIQKRKKERNNKFKIKAI
jgi:hypothetical protein